LRPYNQTSFHHQPEAQHLKSSAIHKLPADYPISSPDFRQYRCVALFGDQLAESRRSPPNIAKLLELLRGTQRPLGPGAVPPTIAGRVPAIAALLAKRETQQECGAKILDGEIKRQQWNRKDEARRQN
jgi:hypothetical protein